MLASAWMLTPGSPLAHLKPSSAIASLLWRSNLRTQPRMAPRAPQSFQGTNATRKVVVVGSGLAGASASLAAAEAGALVVVLESEPRQGGNSMKASSGMNALTPDEGDSPEDFKRDVLKSGRGRAREPLVDALVSDSSTALDFLQSRGVDLSAVVQLGGHSHRRTHANPSGPNVGTAIMTELLERQKHMPGIKVIVGARVTQVRRADDDGRIAGVTYTLEGQEYNTSADAVVLATGGYGANRELLREHAPHAADLATTNGPWAKGEGLVLAQGVGGVLVDMDAVQLHPTGFVGAEVHSTSKAREVGGFLSNICFYIYIYGFSSPLCSLAPCALSA
jgi:succinate dehydrogenase/fumarate reductase flavoprotein subunit